MSQSISSLVRFALAALAIVGAGGASAGWNEYRSKPEEWFRSQEASAVGERVLAWQTKRGDWPNDLDAFSEPFDASKAVKAGTFDDGHTTQEIRFASRMFAATGQEKYESSALAGIDLILQSQYLNGGFPQRFPPGENYPRYITFNDRTMVNLLELLRDVSSDGEFAFVGPQRRAVAAKAVDAGIRCILACQFRDRRGLTAWPAQCDEETFAPRPARPFEPASLAAAESADVLLFLMSLEEPGQEVIASVEAGVEWFERAAIEGIRVETSSGDRVVLPDPTAPPVWARFYDPQTMRPLFAGRDGVVKGRLSEIERERRVGYAWYGSWGEKVFDRYAEWSRRARGGSEP